MNMRKALTLSTRNEVNEIDLDRNRGGVISFLGVNNSGINMKLGDSGLLIWMREYWPMEDEVNTSAWRAYQHYNGPTVSLMGPCVITGAMSSRQGGPVRGLTQSQIADLVYICIGAKL